MDTQTTTLDALDASLQELTKAASKITGEPLAKGDGVNIENTGTMGSDGQQGGGQGSVSDAGKVEELMIGKLTAAGFNASQIGSIVGFMKEAGGGSFIQVNRPSPSGKADEDYDEDEDDEDEDDEDDDEFGKSLSFQQHFRQDPDIDDAVDVSAFLESFVARTTESLDGMHKSQRALRSRSDKQFAQMAKALVALGSLAKSQANVIAELGKRLGVVERQPAAMPRTALTKSAAEAALGKGMPGEVGAGGGRLAKSELASAISYMRIEKGMRQIAGRNVATDIVPNIESGFVDPTVEAEVMNWLRRNPAEAGLAKSYA